MIMPALPAWRIRRRAGGAVTRTEEAEEAEEAEVAMPGC
jgi:hypothetical protein